jgi:hypothetical protein
MNILCLLFGHKSQYVGGLSTHLIIKKGVMNIVKVRCDICERCDEIFVRRLEKNE